MSKFIVDTDWKDSLTRTSEEFTTQSAAIAHAAGMAMDSRVAFSGVRDLAKDAKAKDGGPGSGPNPGGGGESYHGEAERNKHTDRGGRKSLKSYGSNPSVKAAISAYSNNKGSQKAVKDALRKAGASEQEISGVNWNKSYFAQREFE